MLGRGFAQNRCKKYDIKISCLLNKSGANKRLENINRGDRQTNDKCISEDSDKKQNTHDYSLLFLHTFF
jgi:hypothetical protein